MKDDPISQQVLGIALTPLIPLPFVDGFIRTRLLRAIYSRLGEQGGRPLDTAALKHLTEFRGSLVLGCIFAVLWWPIRKFVRTLVYVLTLKECVDVLGDAAMRVAMVKAAVEAGALPQHAKEVRDAMERAEKAHGASPVMTFIRRKDAPKIAAHRDEPTARTVAQVGAYAGAGPALEAFKAELAALKEQPQLSTSDTPARTAPVQPQAPVDAEVDSALAAELREVGLLSKVVPAPVETSPSDEGGEE